MDVAAWLTENGFAQFVKAFHDNDVDAQTLRELTETDLEKLGLPLGPRKRFLRAIAALSPPASAAARRPAAQLENSAERRQLTVLFCDLVGSTALSARLDPEDTRAVISAYHEACAQAIHSETGYVANYMGDGALAYFGYPTAREDDAERAVRAGLAIVERVSELREPNGAPLRARVGIATGVVVVGELIGANVAGQSGVVGDTPNLAARLQAIAAPGHVVIADSTRRLIGDLFEISELGALDLKGVGGPTYAYEAVRPRGVDNRFEALRGADLGAFVGRAAEIEALSRSWSDAVAGRGGVVLISGEPGIGKSRLTAELVARVAVGPYRILRLFSSPQHVDTAFHPIVAQLERAAKLVRNDRGEANFERLRAFLLEDGTPPADISIIADMMGFDRPAGDTSEPLEPLQRRARTLAAVVDRIEAVSRREPALVVFEDAHWADPSSVEAIGRLAERIGRMRALLIVTHRTDVILPLSLRPEIKTIALNRLSPTDIEAVVGAVVGEADIPETALRDIALRADGVPLFAEEIAKAAVEAARDGSLARTIAAIPSPEHQVPASLHASLMSRLDRLGPAKEVAQIGAAIGRDFSRDLIAAVVGASDGVLDRSLYRLKAAGLLYERTSGDRRVYSFKHALVQDAAYGTLLRGPRRVLHGRIAAAFERVYPDIAETRPQTLAFHCAEAGQVERAARLWGKAGQQALARCALIEAQAQLSRALALMKDLPDTPELRRERINLQVALLSPLRHLRGYAAAETRASLEQTRALLERAQKAGEQDPLAPYSVLYGAWMANQSAFNAEVACTVAQQMLDLGQSQDSRVGVMAGHRMLGTTLTHCGELLAARKHLDAAIALYEPKDHALNVRLFALDCGIGGYIYRALVHMWLGALDSAEADLERGLELTRGYGHPMTSMLMLCHSLFWRASFGPDRKAEAEFDEVMTMAREKKAVYWEGTAMLAGGCYRAGYGDPANAIDLLDRGMDVYCKSQGTLSLPFFHSRIAFAQARLGRFEEARRSIDTARAAIDTSGEVGMTPEVDLTSGDIEAMSPSCDAQAAARDFHSALNGARACSGRFMELRAATGLADLWRGQGRKREARDLLAPIYGSFVEGLGTVHLRKAKATLDAVA